MRERVRALILGPRRGLALGTGETRAYTPAVTRGNENVVWHPPALTTGDREAITGHRGAVLWFTGLSGSGKSTIANLVDRALHQRGKHSYLLDGDNLRLGLNRDLSFSPEDRSENIRRLVEVGRLFADAGVLLIVAAISPYRQDRDGARARIGAERFVEIHVDTALETCEARDPKGLYARARAGQIRDFTGIDAPYEPPTAAEVVLEGGDTPPSALAAQVVDWLANHDFL